jgi:CO/xanthine dehydrogenase Mo-binding subunit
VLETAAKQFERKAAKAPSGRAVGVACGMYSNACNATMVEVAVNRARGPVQVKRVVMALDVGMVVIADGRGQQAEGCTIMGLGSLTEEVRFGNGEVLDRNSDSYRVAARAPKMEIHFIRDAGAQALGGGEPMCTGAAIANAAFDAVGARVLRLPMTPERVKAALPGA